MSEIYTTRNRNLPFPNGIPTVQTWGFGPRSASWTFPGFTGHQTTSSEGHPFRKSKSPAMSDLGGPFFTDKTEYSLVGGVSSCFHNGQTPSNGNQYARSLNGLVLPTNPSNVSAPPDLSSSKSLLEQKGTTAIALTSPVNSIANTTVFLGELLKDGIPAIPGIHTWEAKALALKNAGEEFLNVVFGWDPLINDIKSTAKAIRHAEVVMRQFQRDAGKVVRRSYSYPIKRTHDAPVTIASGVAPYVGPTVLGSTPPSTGIGDVKMYRQTVQKRWFSGAFSYYAPSGSSTSGMSASALEAKRVFGLELTPETLWNLAPWSWALDWVSNAGDVLHNLSQHIQYGLVMRYGYVMETTTTQDTYTWHWTGPSGGLNSCPFPNLNVANIVVRRMTKKRYGANPFGFGITWDGLNATQQAIAAALGLSRSR